MGVTRRLVEFLLRTNFDQMPTEVVLRAKELILDTIGVALAGSIQPPAEIAIDYVRHLGGNPQATIIGRGFKTTAPNVALANGISAAALDYDDTNFIMVAHTSGSVLPAVLALGEELGTSGQDILEAYILGYEVGGKVARGIQPAQYIRGWHATGTLGIICCVAACIKLAKLGPQEATNAFGIAGSLACGLRGNFGSMTKPFHSGTAAMNSIFAVSLAKRGFTAGSTIFEHPYGYCMVTTGKEQVQLRAIEEALDSPVWALVDPGVGVKLHPCNSAVLPGIDSTIEIVREHDIKPDQVESIDYGTTPLAIDIARFNEPKTSPEAMYSITHAVAVSVVDRKAGISQFTEERVRDPVVRSLVGKVKSYVHPDLKDVTDPHDIPASYVTIKLKNGQEFTKYRRRPRAYPGGDSISRDDLVEKYRECAGLVLPSQNIDASIALLDKLETVPHIGELIGLLSTT